MEVTSLNVYDGSYIMEVKTWKLLSETYTMEVT